MNYFRVPWVFILLSFYPSGDGTRILPMVIWDHRNPLLNCKCNWLTIPKFDIYDQIDFVCPTRAINVLLTDNPIAENKMNENIFKRKVTNFETLQESLMNGSFCDPDASVKLEPCFNGKGGSFSATFVQASSTAKPVDKAKQDYHVGDMFVFFNNGDNGESVTLGSKKKTCSMVFIVNVTDTEQQQYDMSYGKCLNPLDTCDNGNVSCRYQCLNDNAVINPSLTSPTPNPSSVKTSPTSEAPRPSTSSSTDPNSKVIRCHNFNKKLVVCNNTDSQSSDIFKCNSTYYSNVTCKYFEEFKIYTCNLGINEIDSMVCGEITDTKEPNTGAQSSNTSDRYYLLFIIAVTFASILGFLNIVNIFVVLRKTYRMKTCIKKSLVCTACNHNAKVNIKTIEKTISNNDGVNNCVFTVSPEKDDESNSEEKE